MFLHGVMSHVFSRHQLFIGGYVMQHIYSWTYANNYRRKLAIFGRGRLHGADKSSRRSPVHQRQRSRDKGPQSVIATALYRLLVGHRGALRPGLVQSNKSLFFSSIQTLVLSCFVSPWPSKDVRCAVRTRRGPYTRFSRRRWHTVYCPSP